MLYDMSNEDTTTATPARDGLACFNCDHVSADLRELHNHIWRSH